MRYVKLISISCFRYHFKKETCTSLLQESKRLYACNRNYKWTLSNKRSPKLRQNVKELEVKKNIKWYYWPLSDGKSYNHYYIRLLLTGKYRSSPNPSFEMDCARPCDNFLQLGHNCLHPNKSFHRRHMQYHLRQNFER